MKNIVNTYVRKFKEDHRRSRKAIAMLLALALVVATGVTWQLHSTGIALTNETYCGLEEHQHTEACYETVLICDLEESEGHTHEDSCYETVSTLACGLEESDGHTHSEDCYDEDGNLICGLEESEGHTHTEDCYKSEQVLICDLEESEGHTHTEDCYKEQLICGLEEHTHTVECLVDETADVETASDWEATIPSLSGNWADDLLSVANSQIGYTESTANFTLADDGTTHKGYTRYGAWYGNKYGDWNAMFVSFCLNYAGIPESYITQASGAYAWTVAMSSSDYYTTSSDYTPSSGDVVFLDLDSNGVADCTGIVSSVSGNNMTVIEGDSNNKVEKNTYSISGALAFIDVTAAYEDYVGISKADEEDTAEAETGLEGGEAETDLDIEEGAEAGEDSEATLKTGAEASSEAIVETTTEEGMEIFITVYDGNGEVLDIDVEELLSEVIAGETVEIAEAPDLTEAGYTFSQAAISYTLAETTDETAEENETAKVSEAGEENEAAQESDGAGETEATVSEAGEVISGTITGVTALTNGADGVVVTTANGDQTLEGIQTLTIVLYYENIESEEDETNVETGTNTVSYRASDGGVTVTVTAPEGAVPEGAELSVTLYEEDSDEYATAAEAIGYEAEETIAVATAVSEDSETAEEAEETTATTGLAVLDISFVLNGEKVEPSEAVTVSIDASNILPEDADASTLEVQHLDESGSSVEPVLVADASDNTDGTVDVEAATAEFEVESFSTFTVTWRSSGSTSITTNSSTITCNVYNTSGNTLNVSDAINIVLTEGMAYDFFSEENATLTVNSTGRENTTYTLSNVTVVADGSSYYYVQTISYDGTSYTITYTTTSDGTTQSATVSAVTSVNLYYASTSSSSSQELDLSSYNSSAYVWWDTYNGSTTKSGAESTDDQSYISSVKLNNLTVSVADSDATSWGTGDYTLSDYFPGGTTSTSVYSTLEITPKSGYYITTVVVACTGQGNSGRPGSEGQSGSETPYSCNTWSSGNAFVTTFSVGTSGTVSVDVSSLDFSHSSNSDNYFILICVAPIPSPLYVEYDYGDIVSYIGSDGDSSAFSTSNGWTTTSTNENYYGNGVSDTNADINYKSGYGVMTEDTQYKYAYTTDGDVTAADWIHYANTITSDAKKQAAAAGYVFVGWKAEYYTSVSVSANSDQNTTGYQSDYNNWDYSFSNSYGSTSTYYTENEQVTLTTNVRLIAQWVPIGITVEKEVTGLSETSFSSTEHAYTLEVQKLTGTTTNEDGSTAENWETYKSVTLSVTGDGSASTSIYPLPSGTYRVVETDGNGNLTDDTYIYYITVSTSGNVNVSYNSDYTVSTVDGTSVALLNDSLKVTNSYSEEPATVDVTLKKVNESGGVLSDAVFTLTSSTTNEPTPLEATDTNGIVTMSALTVGGSYILTEVTAPDGYNLLTSSISFIVSSDGVTLTGDYDTSVVSVSDDGLTITVTNTAGFVLPSTGGSGTWMFTLFGLLLCGGAVFALGRGKRVW